MDPDDLIDLPEAAKDEICAVGVVQPVVVSFTALVLDGNVRKDQSDDIVGYRPKVKLLLDPRHQLELDAFNGDGIVLESERLMLGVDEGLPEPGQNDDLLPEGDVRVVVMIVTKLVVDLSSGKATLLELPELLEAVDVFFNVQCVVHIENSMVTLQQSEKNLVLLVLNWIVANV